MERTLVVLKPDAVARGLAGEIIARFERVGLKIVGAKMVMLDREFVGKHYADDEERFRINGERTLGFWKENGKDPKEDLGTDDPIALGRMVREWLFDYLTEGPVLAMVLQGPHAIELVRKHVGSTYPLTSAPGTIRGDYHYDSPTLANFGKRAIINLVHASGNADEAEFEIKWFV